MYNFIDVQGRKYAKKTLRLSALACLKSQTF